MVDLLRPEMQKILILSDKTDSQVKQLCEAFAKRGVHAQWMRLSDIGFDSRYPSGIAIPGFDGALPAGVIVRSVSAGSFEAITRRLGILHAFDHLKVPVWNSAKAIERCVDKSTTTFLLAQAGLATPDTFAVETIANAHAVVEREMRHGPLVLKPLFGSQGRGLRLVKTPEDLPDSVEVDDVFYLQRFIDKAGPPYRDYRVFICDGQVLGMMARRADGWITNIAQGAQSEPVPEPLRSGLETLALAASDTIGTAFTGIDIVVAPDGQLMVLEVNSMPAWTGLQSVVPVKIAERIAEAMLAQIAATSVARERPAA